MNENSLLWAINLCWLFEDRAVAVVASGDISFTLKGDDKSKFGLRCESIEVSSLQDAVGDIFEGFT
jgi:hypothetical protein